MVSDQGVDQCAVFLSRHTLDLPHKAGRTVGIAHRRIERFPQEPTLVQTREIAMKKDKGKTINLYVLQFQCTPQLRLPKFMQSPADASDQAALRDCGGKPSPDIAHSQ